MKLSAINRRIYPKNMLLSEGVAYIELLTGHGNGQDAKLVLLATWVYWLENLPLTYEQKENIRALDLLDQLRLHPDKIKKGKKTVKVGMTELARVSQRLSDDLRWPDLADLIAIVFYRASPEAPLVWEQGQRKAVWILEKIIPDFASEQLEVPPHALNVDANELIEFKKKIKASGRTDLLTGYIDPRRRKIDPIGFAGFQQRGGRVIDTFVQIIEVLDMILTLIDRSIRGESLSDFSEFLKWKSEGKSFNLYDLNDAQQRFNDTYKQLSAAGKAKPIIMSPSVATATLNKPFNYTIVASSPASLGASDLPPDLSVDDSGVISGTPTEAGSFIISLTATNAAGTSTATLSLTVGDEATGAQSEKQTTKAPTKPAPTKPAPTKPAPTKPAPPITPTDVPIEPQTAKTKPVTPPAEPIKSTTPETPPVQVEPEGDEDDEQYSFATAIKARAEKQAKEANPVDDQRKKAEEKAKKEAEEKAKKPPDKPK